jgi:hypothetical protein
VLTGELLKLKEDEKAIRLGIMRESDRMEQKQQELSAHAHNGPPESLQSQQIPLPQVPFHPASGSGSLNLRGLAANTSSESSVTEVITKTERQ